MSALEPLLDNKLVRPEVLRAVRRSERKRTASAQSLPLSQQDGGSPPWLHLLMMFLMVVTQIAWGLFPVCCRYLQAFSDHPIPTVRLNFLVNLLAAPALFLSYTLPKFLWCFGKRVIRSVSSMSLASFFEDDDPRPCLTWHQFWYLTAMSACLLVLAITNLLAVRLTLAYWVQLVFLLTPLFVAIMTYFFLRAPLPYKFRPTVIVTSIGATLIIVGASESSSGQYKLGMHDVWGLVFALVSTMSIAVFTVLTQKTSNTINESQVLWAMYISQLGVSAAISVPLEGTDFSGLMEMDKMDWAYLLFASVGVYWGANFAQQAAIRFCGAAMFAAFLAVRPLSAIVGSHFLLGESISNPIEAAGIVVVVGCVSWYLWVQWRMSSKAHAARTYQAVDAPTGEVPAPVA